MKSLNNVQKIAHLMTMNPGGPLAQAMILEAVRQYCSSVVAAGRPADNPTGIISAQPACQVARPTDRRPSPSFLPQPFHLQ